MVAGNKINLVYICMDGEHFWSSSSSWLHFANIGKSASENWKTRLKDIFWDQLSSPLKFFFGHKYKLDAAKMRGKVGTLFRDEMNSNIVKVKNLFLLHL